MEKGKTAPDPPSIRDAFDFARGTLRSNFTLFTAWMLTFLASWVILEILVVAGQRFGLIWWLAAHLGFFFVFAGLQLGFTRICLDLHEGKQSLYADLFRFIHLGANFFLIQLIYIVILMVGLVLLIFPGVFFATRYTFYAFTLIDGNPDSICSFRQSALVSEGSMWFLFGLSILILLFNIIGASILGIGLLLTIPLSALIKVHIYCQLK